MSESDTPRCDAYEIRDGIRYVSVPRSDLPNWSSFARQLERELNCAQENFHVTNQAYVKADARAEKAERALAQSQTEIVALNGIIRVRSDALAQSQARCAELEKECQANQ